MSSHPLQILSYYPAIPAPVDLDIWQSPPHPCSYLPGRAARFRAFFSDALSPEIYHQFMNANYRRSGRLIYQPICTGCRACRSLRVSVMDFKPSKSQRRCLRRNEDLQIAVNPPAASEEKYQLFRAYQTAWHDQPESSFEDFQKFLYESPVDSAEFEYRDEKGRLIAVGICDVCVPLSLSSVYFYFDPSESKRSLGTFGALRELAWAADNAIAHYYLGYWVEPCDAMHYKASFHPYQLLCGDGQWRDADEVNDGSRL